MNYCPPGPDEFPGGRQRTRTSDLSREDPNLTVYQRIANRPLTVRPATTTVLRDMRRGHLA